MIFFLESGKILLTEIVSDISRPESAFSLLDNTIKHHFSGGNNPCNVPLSISAPTLYVYPYTMRKKRILKFYLKKKSWLDNKELLQTAISVLKDNQNLNGKM